MEHKPIILASGSPRRREMLDNIGLDFSIVPSEFEEDNSLDIPPMDLVQQLALGKAQWVAERHPEAIVVGVDTLMSYEGIVLGKPGSEAGVVESITKLNGQTHSALSGFAIVSSERTVTDAVETHVVFRHLSEEEIAAYARTGEGVDKAGGYGIQGKGSLLVERIDGDYFNVVGLPLSRLAVRLCEFGVDLLSEGGTASGKKAT